MNCEWNSINFNDGPFGLFTLISLFSFSTMRSGADVM